MRCIEWIDALAFLLVSKVAKFSIVQEAVAIPVKESEYGLDLGVVQVQPE